MCGPSDGHSAPAASTGTLANSAHRGLEREPRVPRPRVVIVGGGFGGLYAARGLARAPVDVTIVDKNNYHLFRPMLYQVATGLLSSDEIAAPIRSIKVNPDLAVPGHPNVFAIGDTATVAVYTRSLLGGRSRTPEAVGGVAQVAIQGGAYVARVISRRVSGAPPPPPFWYWDKGNLAIVGRAYAVADLKHVRFSGLLAWMLWAGVHIYFLIGFANRLNRGVAPSGRRPDEFRRASGSRRHR
jgi:NADH dehydrogenase FAD-containing subunit